MEFKIAIANETYLDKAQEVCDLIKVAAKKRGTGIAKRSPEYIQEKIKEGKAIIAVTNDNQLAGFCYIETWQHGKYVVNSGLIIAPEFQKMGLAKKIKKTAFELSVRKYPNSKIFGLTTSLPVMKINSDLGYRPVTFSELTDDEQFWKGCQSCVNYDILTRTEKSHCLCTGMLYDPKEDKKNNSKSIRSVQKYKNWLKSKQEKIMNKLKFSTPKLVAKA